MDVGGWQALDLDFEWLIASLNRDGKHQTGINKLLHFCFDAGIVYRDTGACLLSTCSHTSDHRNVVRSMLNHFCLV